LCALCAWITLLACGCQPRPVSVSILQLLHDPHAYEAERISAVGVLDLEAGAGALYLTGELREHHIVENAIRLDFGGSIPKERLEALRSLAGHYVRVQGFFEPGSRGDEPAFIGTLTGISGVEPVERRKDEAGSDG
jgi:hypothetical protein